MERRLQRNIITIYCMAFCQSFMIIVAVFVPLMQRHGLSMSEVLQTQALFALVVAVCEVPSGYLADIWGRIKTIRIGQALYALSFFWLVQADSFSDFIIYEFVIGIGISLSSGADLALLYDTQSALDQKRARGQDKPGRHIARLVAIEGYSGAGAAVAASLLSFISLDWVLWAQSLAGGMALLFSMFLIEAPRLVSSGSHQNNIRKVIDDIVSRPLVLWTTLSIVIFGLIGLFAFWTFQKYWESQDIPIEWFGFLYAFSCITRGVSAQYAQDIESLLGWKKVLVLCGLLPVAGFLVMGISGGVTGLIFSLCFPVSRGISMVMFYDALNKRLAADFRATVNSIASLGTRALFIITGPLLGLLVDRLGVNSSLLLVGVCFSPIILVLLGRLAFFINAQIQLGESGDSEKTVAVSTGLQGVNPE